ncbi:MAG: thiopeptide-type bacteriocin biosynthesis protein [Acidobacteriota bacterium]
MSADAAANDAEAATQSAPLPTFDPARWCAVHLHYHEDRDRLLDDCVRPLVETLHSDGAIDRFFFIRYSLGGPHVRLRLRGAAGVDLAAVQARVHQRARTFLDHTPSRSAQPAEDIAEANQVLLRDAQERDPGTIPDNHSVDAPFRPETKRYGGPNWLGASLDVFDASSRAALALLHRHRDASPAQRLPQTLRLLGVQIASAARGDAARAVDLAGYAGRWWQETWAPLIAHGDQLFEARGSAIGAALTQDAAQLRDGEGLDPSWHALARATAALADRLADDDARTAAGQADAAPSDTLSKRTRRILESQLHMTANRLGWTNPDEVYLGHVLARVLDAGAPRT